MTKVNLLKYPIVNEIDFYNSFLLGKLREDGYFTNEFIDVPDVGEFITYSGNDRKNRGLILKNLIKVMMNNFIDLPQNIYMSKNFWMSYLVTELRMSLFRNHPQIKNKFQTFKLIVLRDLDWENYIYKAAVYGVVLKDNLSDIRLLDDYIDTITENMDFFNYILKYTTLNNDNFIFNMIKFLHKNKNINISAYLKKKVFKDKDERFGRLVLAEINRTYPSILFPMLDYQTFEEKLTKVLIKLANQLN